jgi:serine/threonine protein kinase
MNRGIYSRNLNRQLPNNIKGIWPLNETQVAFVCREILNVLEIIHLNGYIHWDIKADNILLNKKGEKKLADFGETPMVSKLLARYLLWNALYGNLI